MDKMSNFPKCPRIFDQFHHLSIFLIPLFWFSNSALGYPGGAPGSTCVSLTPRHGFEAQTSLLPFYLNVNKLEVAPGEKVEITLASTGTSGPFKGFLAVGRTSSFSRDTTPWGKFIGEKISAGDEPQAKLTNCSGSVNASATHLNNKDKERVVLEWEAPQQDGVYTIVVTVLQNKETFWVANPSAFIKVGSGNEPDPSDDIKAIYDGCGETKGCHGAPTGCLETRNCGTLVTYIMATGNAAVQFELVGNVASFNALTSYVALGLSSDNKMGDDSVFACRLDKNTIAINEYYTRQNYEANFAITRPGQGIITEMSGQNVNGFISCKFTVLATYEVEVTGESTTKSWDLVNNSFHLLLVRGDEADETILHKHIEQHASAESTKLSDMTGPVPPPPPPEDLAQIYKGCGETKGCFGLGSSACVNNRNCEMMVTYQVTQTAANLQLTGRGPTDHSYVAVGLSSDKTMGSDSVFGCRLDGDKVLVNEYYNTPEESGSYNTQVSRETSIISNASGTVIDGFIACSFTVSKTYPVDSITRNFDLEKDVYYLLMARGTSSGIDGLGKHPTANDRSASSNSVRLSDTSVLGAKSTVLIQLHGSFMILAWLLCASSGMFTARYYKQTHTRFQPMGVAVWFVVHRICMVLTVLFNIAAFVLIFVEIGGLTSRNGGNAEKSHPILGIILTALAVLQVCLATVRPHPGHSKRPLFNWIHWSVGNAAHILGIACIYLANDLQKSNLQQTRYWGVITAFICYHITLHVALTVLQLKSDKKLQIQEPKRAVALGPMPPSGVSGEAPGTEIRSIIFAAYILGAAATAICLIYFVVDALRT